MEEFGQVWKHNGMDGCECVEEDLVGNVITDQKSVELMLYRGDVTDGRSLADDTGSCLLDQLQYMKEFVRETKITIVQTGGDERGD